MKLPSRPPPTARRANRRKARGAEVGAFWPPLQLLYRFTCANPRSGQVGGHLVLVDCWRDEERPLNWSLAGSAGLAFPAPSRPADRRRSLSGPNGKRGLFRSRAATIAAVLVLRCPFSSSLSCAGRLVGLGWCASAGPADTR